MMLSGSFGGETTPTSVTTRKSPTMDAGVQTSGGLTNNSVGGGGMSRGPRGGGGGGGAYMRGQGYQRAGIDNRRYQPQYNTYGGRYQQNDMRGGRPPLRG